MNWSIFYGMNKRENSVGFRCKSVQNMDDFFKEEQQWQKNGFTCLQKVMLT